MSVCLPVKMCSWDRQLTYLVRNVISSLIISVWYLLYMVVSRCVFKRGINPYMFRTFRICCYTSRITCGRCIYWPNRQFNFRSNNVINSGQNCILSSIVSTILLISLSILSLKQLSKVFASIAFSLIAELLLEVPTVKFRSLESPLTTLFSWLCLAALPRMISWSKSSNWLRSLLFDCLFLRVETMFVLIIQFYLKSQH